MHALFHTFLALQKLLKAIKVWQSCSKTYTATFYESRQKCFNFSRYGAHINRVMW